MDSDIEISVGAGKWCLVREMKLSRDATNDLSHFSPESVTMVLLKICGIKELEDAQVAIDGGAGLVGMIMCPGRSRTADPAKVKQVAAACREARGKLSRKYKTSQELLKIAGNSSLEGAEWFEQNAELVVENGPFLVGVFRNQPLGQVIEAVDELQLDFVQLHGSEDVSEFRAALNVPIIARFVPSRPNIGDAMTKTHFLTLLDSEFGGQGELIDWNDAQRFYEDLEGRYLLSGGLTPENVAKGLKLGGCLGADVATGVETDGVKDKQKIRAFLANAAAIGGQ